MSAAASPRLSVIVPTLNEARCLAQTLDAIDAMATDLEVIVADGGSDDGTPELARARGVRVLADVPRGRGSQMRAGAEAAAAPVLFFLHADTLPPPDAFAQIARALDEPATVAGNFEIRFDGDSFAARWLTWVYRHLALIGLRYGDSGYFVRRDAYDAVGGFRPHPIFEDLDLLRRLRKRGRFVRVPGVVTTSSRRFEGRSFAFVFARWTFLQVLYWLGVPPATLGRMYRHIRMPGPRRRGGSR